VVQAVLDTNILVSAIWTPAGSASKILELILTDKIIPCFDDSIMKEYKTVLSRPRLALPKGLAKKLLAEIAERGIMVSIYPGKDKMTDEADRKFYDTAKFFEAWLVTGNIKRYPKDPLIISPSRFLEKMN